MKCFLTIVLPVWFAILASPASAQRDANTSSARAAYSVERIYSEPRAKKIKQKAEKPQRRKARKIKSKDPQLARTRRSSLHF